jgi:cysteine desulfurase
MTQPLHYFDNNATTRVAPEVLEAMTPFLTEQWGNPSSAYYFGHQTSEAINAARENVAKLIGADEREIVFTSCGTESINAVLHSAAISQPGKRQLVTMAVEHSATLKYCEFLKQRGFDLTIVPVRPDGLLDLELLQKAVTIDTALVSVLSANNETGVIFPVKEIAALCRQKGTLFHTDAIQAAGRIPLDVKDCCVDFLSLSAHKLHGPKGVGALYIKRGLKFQPLLIGGDQERGRRAGTENVASIVGFGRAAELAVAQMPEAAPRMAALRDKLEHGILKNIDGTAVNGSREFRLPNTTNMAFEGVEAEGILLLLDQAGICASSGSACKAGSLDPSHVLLAMGHDVGRARGSVRFSLSRYTSQAEVDYVLAQLPGIVRTLRGQLR